MAKEWREILQELHHRGVPEAGFIVAEGLAGLKEAITEVFPRSRYQRCVVHMMRRSNYKVRARDREAISNRYTGRWIEKRHIRVLSSWLIDGVPFTHD